MRYKQFTIKVDEKIDFKDEKEFLKYCVRSILERYKKIKEKEVEE